MTKEMIRQHKYPKLCELAQKNNESEERFIEELKRLMWEVIKEADDDGFFDNCNHPVKEWRDK